MPLLIRRKSRLAQRCSWYLPIVSRIEDRLDAAIIAFSSPRTREILGIPAFLLVDIFALESNHDSGQLLFRYFPFGVRIRSAALMVFELVSRLQ